MIYNYTDFWFSSALSFSYKKHRNDLFLSISFSDINSYFNYKDSLLHSVPSSTSKHTLHTRTGLFKPNFKMGTS